MCLNLEFTMFIWMRRPAWAAQAPGVRLPAFPHSCFGRLELIREPQVEEALGEVDVLLIPVGGGESLSASQASEVVSLLEPHIVIPMHYQVPEMSLELDPVGKFLKEMGLDKVTPQEVLKVSRSGLPDETQIVLLELRSKEE